MLEQPVIGDAMIIVAFDTFYSFFAGIAMLSVMGHINAIDFPLKSPGGLLKTYVAIPNVIATNSSNPQIWSLLFFTGLFFIYVDTSISWVETIVTIIIDTPLFCQISRWKIVGATCIFGIVFATSYTSSWGVTHSDAIRGGP